MARAYVLPSAIWLQQEEEERYELGRKGFFTKKFVYLAQNFLLRRS